MDTIRGLEEQDWDRWLPLWHDYLNFYRAELSDETTRSTFGRLCGEADGMFGFLAVNEGGDAIGLAHCLVHPTTWSRRPYCYLEDLYVPPEARGRNPSALRKSVAPVASTGIPSSTTAEPDRSTTRSVDRPRSSSMRCRDSA